MKSKVVQVSDFKGIVDRTSSSTTDPASFANLVNMSRQPAGGLQNRYGYKYLFNLTARPTAFTFNKFIDIPGYVFLLNGSIVHRSNSGALTDIFLNLTATITSGGKGSITINSPIDQSFVGAVIYNRSKNIWNTIKAIVGVNIVGSVIQFSTVSSVDWSSGEDVLVIKSGFTSPDGITVNFFDTPQFKKVDQRSNLVISGVGVGTNSEPIWIGQIYDYKSSTSTERKFWGGILKYKGLYVSPLYEEFKYGAFKSDVRHISIKTVDHSGVAFSYSDPNSDIHIDGWNKSSGATYYEQLRDNLETTYIYTDVDTAVATIGFSQIVNRVRNLSLIHI